ncbi:MAG: leucine-rich repeat protein [Bacteroidaceae bacterium]|nr:leucine-rich repeat protein [Bacteroidaceae bacterium]
MTSISIPSSVTKIGNWAFQNCSGLTSVSIPNGVTIINMGVFKDCSALTSVSNLNNIVAIGESAFEGCSKLSSINIPSSVSSVGKNAFLNTAWYNSQADGLVYAGSVAYKYKGNMPSNTQISIRNGTKGIASSAFDGCKTLVSIEFPNSLTNIGDGAFRNCNISLLNFPSSLTTIGEESFEYCNRIQELILPEGVQSVGFSAFWNCNGLKSITIPKSLVKIDRNAFNACYNLQTITVASGNPIYDSRNNCNAIIETSSNMLLTGTINTIIPEGVKSIGDCAFKSSTMTSIKIPSTLQSLGNESFSCSNMKTIVVDERNQYLNSYDNCNAIIETATNTILYGCINTVLPKNTTKIGAYAFTECRWTEYVIPEGIVDIGNSAFWCNRQLTLISLPSTLQNITGQNIFSQCDKLKTVICHSLTPPISQYGIGFPNSGKDMTLYVPKNTKEAYEKANAWKNFGNIIELDDQQLEAYAVLSSDQTTLSFYYDGNKSNKQGTVYTADQFRTPSGNGWSSSASSINTVTFDPSFADFDGVTSTSCWFSNCSNLKVINEINNLNTGNVTDMSYMFSGCRNLTSLDVSRFNTGNAKFMYYMFYNCSSLTDLDVKGFNTENALTMLRMFGGCSNLTNLDLSNFKTDKVQDMTGMFQNCKSLKKLDLSGWNTKRVMSMDHNTNPDEDWGMFSGCSSLITIKVGEDWNTDNVTSSAHMFNNCVSIVGGDGTKFNPDFIDKTKAYAGPGGYLTMDGQEVEDHDYDWSIGSGGDFADVNAAMSDSRVKDGDVLQVLNGTILNGTTYITKAVTIKGNGYEDKSDGHIYGIYIDCEGVTLKNLHNGYIYVRANNAIIERCRTSSISGRENYESDDVTIRGCLVLGYVCSYYNNISYGWKISNNIIIATNYWGNALDYLEEATVDHNLIINYESDVYGLYAVGAVNNSSFTNNIFLRPAYSQGISDNAVNSATKFEYNIVSNSGTFAKWPANITGYNNMAKLFECSGERTTDTYYKLVAGSPALGYANDGGDCGPWSGAFPYLINGKENTSPEPDPTQWKLDPTLTTDTERYEFATLDALVDYLLNNGKNLKESVMVSVADATYTMDLIPNINTSNFGSVDEMIKYMYYEIEPLRERILAAEEYYRAYNITFSMEAQHEAIFQFNLQNSQAYNAFLEFMAAKIVEMQAQGMSQEEVDARKAQWFAQIKEYMNCLYEAMQKFASHIKTTNIIIFLDNTRINPDPDSIEPNDLLALKNIYNMLGGSTWTNKKWKINDYGAKKEDFPGVTFDDEGYVVEINLENNNLRGTINPTGWTWQLCLPRLTGLYLQKNNISGDLSPWLKGVNRNNRLKALNMSYNNLTEISDTIPSSITSLNLENQNREWYRPDGVYTDPLKIEAMSDMTPIRLYLSANQTVVMPSLFTYNHKSLTHSARPTIYIINAEGIDKYGYFKSSGEDTYSLAWKDNEYTEKQNAPCYVRFDNPYGSVYPAYLRYIEGDANMSGYTDVLDVQTTLNYVLNGGGVWQFNRSAANTYEDNLINVQDIVCMVNIVLNNEAVAEGIILNTSSSRRHLRRAADAMDAQGWLYTEKGRVMLTTVNEVGAIDLELKGVSTSQVSLLLNHSQYQMIGRNTEEGSRYVIFSPTGQPIPASEEVALLAVSSQTELIGAQAADMEAQELELAIGQPTGLEAIDNGQLTNDNAPIYNVAGQRLSKMQRGINITNGRKVLK